MNKRQCSSCPNLKDKTELKLHSNKSFRYFCIKSELQPINAITECSLANNGKGGVNLF